MGQRFTLSFSDIKMANEAYGCGGIVISYFVLLFIS